MGDDAPTSLGVTNKRNLQSMQKYLPQYGELVRSEILPYEQAQLDASKVISPQYYDLLTSLYEQYAPQLAAAGYNIDRDITQKTLADAVQNQATYGTQMATQAANLDRSLDPEYYKTRETTSNKLGELLGSIDLNNANPEAERLVNQETLRSGNITPSSMQTTANALSFGDQLQKRRNALGQAISAATQFLPQSRTGFSSIATGAAAAGDKTGTLQGLSQFGGVQSPGKDAQNAGSMFYQGGMQQQMNKAQLDDNNQAGVMKIHQGILGTLDAV